MLFLFLDGVGFAFSFTEKIHFIKLSVEECTENAAGAHTATKTHKQTYYIYTNISGQKRKLMLKPAQGLFVISTCVFGSGLAANGIVLSMLNQHKS